MKFLKTYFPLFFIVLASGIFLISRLGRDLLNDWDECIYASYTHSMKTGSGFLANVFNSQRIFDKPPMYTWMLSAMTTFGENEFMFRILSALATLALIFSVYLFAQRYFSKRTAVLASLLLLTSESVISRAIQINTDTFFSLFIFLGVWTWLESDKKNWLSYTSGALFGLGVMVKGLGSLQFILVIFISALLDQNKKSIARFLKLFVAFLVVILPWHVIAFALHQKEFLQVYLYDNLIKRSLYPIENHHERWYFYIRQIAIELFPWIVFFNIAPIYLYRRLRHVRSFKTFHEVWEKNRVLFTLLLLVILPLISMMRVKTKLSWYALPLYPFLVILLAYYVIVFLRKFASTVMQGPLGSSLVNAIFAIIIVLVSIDAFTSISHQVRLTDGERPIGPREAAVLETQKYSQSNLEYLVPFGERQGYMTMPKEEQIFQTWLYGGNACAVYYSKKHVNYFYNTENFVKKATTQKGLFFLENGDLHYIDPIPNKNILFKNVEYTLFRVS